MNFDQAFKVVIGHEGGYVNHPNDPGGETKYGISKRAYPNEDIKSLTLDRAKEIYKRDYWDKGKTDKLPKEIRYAYFDMAVNSGVRTAIKTLQSACGITDDGVIGPQTLMHSEKLKLSDFLFERALFYMRITGNKPKLSVFLKGWANRLESIKKESL